jgi:hypothetical protein
MRATSAATSELSSPMLSITGWALQNARYTCVQLRSQARSTFPDLTIVSTLDAVGSRPSDRLADESPVSRHLF